MDGLDRFFDTRFGDWAHGLGRLPVAVLLLAGAACTPTHEWHHPEYSDSQRRADLRLCDRKAYREAPIAFRHVSPAQPYARYRPSSDYLGPNCGYSCAGKRADSYNRQQQSLASGRTESYRLVDDQVSADCMRALGYSYRKLVRE